MRTDTVRVNFTLPEKIYQKFHMVIPKRQMSKVISHLMEQEIERRNKTLFKIAESVEKDKGLNREMRDWDNTGADGLDDLQWK